jgi:hypothetical protein
MTTQGSASGAGAAATALDVPHPGMPSDAELVEALRLQLEAMLPPARDPDAPRGADEVADIAALLADPHADEGGEEREPTSQDAAAASSDDASRPAHDEATLSLLDELDRLWARGGA